MEMFMFIQPRAIVVYLCNRTTNCRREDEVLVEELISCATEKVGDNSEMIVANAEPICALTARRQLLIASLLSKYVSLFPAFVAAQELIHINWFTENGFAQTAHTELH
jgi:hypothetical protein